MKNVKVMVMGLLFAGLLLSGNWQAVAAEYPERGIEIIVPFGVGGGSDTAARAVVEGMKPLLKVPVVVTNLSGGGGTKGMLQASLQPADGYTVFAT
ncbi:MAG: hypothetical protein P1P89_19820, partial [Desulfobacterales bacterium]|nr:hypothetical protein [Desulfobacterales bacterium]